MQIFGEKELRYLTFQEVRSGLLTIALPIFGLSPEANRVRLEPEEA